MVNIFDPSNPIYNSASTLFPQTNGLDPYVQSITNQGLSAANKAKTNTIANLVKSGFGRTTFAEPLGAQSASLAQQPFIQAASQAQTQNRQQQIQNFMNALQLGTSNDINYQTLQAQIDAQNRKNQSTDLATILGGGLQAVVGMFNPALAATMGVGKTLFGPQPQKTIAQPDFSVPSVGINWGR